MVRLITLTLAIVFALSLAVSAATVDLSYVFGDMERTATDSAHLTATSSGFLLSGDTRLAGPFGIMFDVALLSHDEYEYDGEAPDVAVEGQTASYDFMGSYDLPLDAINLKALGGYSVITTGCKETGYGSVYTDDRRLKGFVVGAAAELPVGPVTVSSKLKYIPMLSLHSDWASTGDDDLEGQADAEGSRLFCDIKASYHLFENVALEGGYRADTIKYTWKDSPNDREYTWSYTGFFLGARASF